MVIGKMQMRNYELISTFKDWFLLSISYYEKNQVSYKEKNSFFFPTHLLLTSFTDTTLNVSFKVRPLFTAHQNGSTPVFCCCCWWWWWVFLFPPLASIAYSPLDCLRTWSGSLKPEPSVLLTSLSFAFFFPCI